MILKMYNFNTMGNNSSKKTQSFDQEKLKEEALKNFNIRIKSYSYAHHGSHYEYIQWCRAQYELECIPEFCRKGRNFREIND
jgi:hypothetical protein